MTVMRLLKSLAVLAGALLVGFHGWLLATQIADGRMESWVILRWIIAAGLVAGLVSIRNQRASIFGRKSIAIWVLAALLHGPAVASKFGDTFTTPAIPEAVVTMVLRTASIGLVAIGLWILAGLIARAAHKPRFIVRPAFARRPNRLLDVGCSTRFAPRPPPHRR